LLHTALSSNLTTTTTTTIIIIIIIVFYVSGLPGVMVTPIHFLLIFSKPLGILDTEGI